MRPRLHIFHKASQPTILKVCTLITLKLTTRADDVEEVVHPRLYIFHKGSQPTILKVCSLITMLVDCLNNGFDCFLKWNQQTREFII